MFRFQIESQEELVSRWHKKSTALHCSTGSEQPGLYPEPAILPFPTPPCSIYKPC